MKIEKISLVGRQVLFLSLLNVLIIQFAVMATENKHHISGLSCFVIGKAFVEQYYIILQRSPEMAHRFYQDASILAHPDPDGTLSLVTTMKGISEKLLSLKYDECDFDIETIDAQNSCNGGVIVHVTGQITRQSKIQRKFSQSFFLAPQENNGFFVLNDILRISSEDQELDECASTNQDSVSQACNSTDLEVKEKNHEQDYESVSSTQSALNVENPQQEVPPVEKAEETVKEHESKKSYASAVKVTKRKKCEVYVPQIKSSIKESDSVPLQKTAESTCVNNSKNEEKGHVIYAGNLPRNATPAEVKELFKMFGAIRKEVKIFVHKYNGHRFCFVEFESASSARAAIKASTLELRGRHIFTGEAREKDGARGASYSEGVYYIFRGRGPKRFHKSFSENGGSNKEGE